MASAGLNLATLSPAARMDIAVDLIARRLIHFRKDKGKLWHEWANAEIEKLAEKYRQPVRARLNYLLGLVSDSDRTRRAESGDQVV